MSRNQWLTKGLPNSSISWWNPWILLDVPCLIVETNPFGYSKVSNIRQIYLDVGDSWNVLTSTTKNFCHTLQLPPPCESGIGNLGGAFRRFFPMKNGGIYIYIPKLWKLVSPMLQNPYNSTTQQMQHLCDSRVGGTSQIHQSHTFHWPSISEMFDEKVIQQNHLAQASYKAWNLRSFGKHSTIKSSISNPPKRPRNVTLTSSVGETSEVTSIKQTRAVYQSVWKKCCKK